MEYLVNVWSWLTTYVFGPVSSGATAFWNDVIVPAGEAIETWATAHVHWAYDWMEFCFNLFKLKFSIRVASFALMIPLTVLAIVGGLAGRRRKRRRRA